MKIGVQLSIGFGIILSFVITIGIVSFTQTSKMHEQIYTMYEHPLTVRRTLDILNRDISTISLSQKDIILGKSYEERHSFVIETTLADIDAKKQFDNLKNLYLGPPKDVEEAYKYYIIWKISVEEYNNLVLLGDMEKNIKNLSPETIKDLYRNDLEPSIKKIDQFSINKSDELYKASNELRDKLNKQLYFLILSILGLLILIGYIILRNILNPLREMGKMVSLFQNGEMSSRSSYESKNEFGILSSSINNLAAMIEDNMNLNKKSSNLAKMMLKEDEIKKFFRNTLNTLAGETNSQMAGVYLLNEKDDVFQYFESIGLDEGVKESFSKDSLEGEFGAAILSGNISHIKNIPLDTPFVFNTMGGKFIPREIITIPIIAGDKTVAIISLATIFEFKAESIEFINSSLNTISARIEGILAYENIKKFKGILEKQNKELTDHKTELSMQTSELKQQNSELEMQKKQLDEGSKLKTNFLSNMSHELRTPLNSVIALSGVLSRRLLDQIPPEEYSYLEIIERNGKNLLNLINDVLDISRIESGKTEIEIEKFNVNSIISELIEMIEPQAKQKDILLINESKDLDIYINSDSDKLRHILQNIIGNAVKFTQEGKVSVETIKGDKTIEIRVIDTGIGISEENLPHIFDEFRQADGSTSRRFGGTGLGLAIAKKYANFLGGTITVESTIDVGTGFTITLPLVYDEYKLVKEKNVTSKSNYMIEKLIPKSDSPHTNKTILLVEDNESAIIQMKDFVEGMGHRVLAAHNATEAFEIIEKTIPDAMILDLMMPDIDGFKVLEIMRNAEATANIPVLILTAKHITKEDLKTLKRNNIHQLIQKGDVDRQNLQNAINDMLNIAPNAPKESKQSKEVKEPKESKIRDKKKEQNTEKPVVLVIEDNLDNMITVRAILHDKFIVIESLDGLDGIEMAKKNVPDFILMDIALPGINGIEAFKEIRKIKELEHIPVIALTASAMDQDKEAILSQGFDDFIAKPIIANELFKVISEVLYGK